MLTKKEREEIAERFKNYDKAEYVTLYSGMYDGLLGEHVPKETTVKKDRMELASRILELCDTSDMVKLPRDKDGEVIHVGDIVYEREGTEWQVHAINLFENCSNVSVRSGNVYTTFRSDVLAHKNPTENAVLAAQIRAVVRSAISMPNFAVNKLSNIADQLEKLGDSDD